MKIIIDESVPHIVKHGLPNGKILSVQEMGWAGIKNGQLLKLVSRDFDLFITSDKNLRHQQNLTELDVKIILLPSNQVACYQSFTSEDRFSNNKFGRKHVC